MQITDEQSMIEFCERVNRDAGGIGVSLVGYSLQDHITWGKLNDQEITAGRIGNGSHLQQGIRDLIYHSPELIVQQTPFIYPSGKIITERKDLTGPMTGNLSNCYDPINELFLFHMRGNDISAPFGFQAAAAGMGVYGQHPGLTAALELQQEAGLENFVQFNEGSAISLHPFMKGGENGIPQPLLSYGFIADLSGYEVLKSPAEVDMFEDAIKIGISSGHTPRKEGYHFVVPLAHADNLAKELDKENRFYGPILNSHRRFQNALGDAGYFG